jgi:hypothetical protein
MISSHAQSYPCLSTGRINFCTTSYGIMQTSTNPRRQSRCVDLGNKGAKHLIPITHILTTWHGMVNPVVFSLCLLDCTYPSPSISPLSAEDDDGKLDSHVKRECDLKGHIPYQCDVGPNEYNSSRMAIFSCGTTNAHGWYVSGSNSWYVAFSNVLSAASQDRQLNESTNNNHCWCDERVAF